MPASSARGLVVRVLLPFAVLALVLCAMMPIRLAAQTPDLDPFLADYAATFRFSLGQPAGIRLTRSGDAVLFVRSGPRSFVRDLYEYDITTGKERRLASAEQILAGGQEQLTAEELARRERMRMAARGIADFSIDRSGNQVLVPLSGSLYVLDRKTGKSREFRSDSGFPVDPQFAPSGDAIACVRNNDLYVIELKDGRERRLTHSTSDTLSYGTAEFVAQEEMNRMRGYWWSPDGQFLAYQETDTSQVERWQIADPVRPDKQPNEWRYPRPGKNNARIRLGIIPVTGGETIWVKWDTERFPYLAQVTWESNAPLTILVQNREQTQELLCSVDSKTGELTPLLTETDEAWINLDDSMPVWFSDGERFLWSSMREGNWQLELRRRDGSLQRVLVSADLNYRRLLGVDEVRRRLFVAAGPNPTESHVYQISFDDKGSTIEPLTRSPSMNSAIYSKDSGVSVRISSDLTGRVEYKVYDTNGQPAGELEDESVSPPFVPNVELAEVSGSTRRYWASIVRPRDFQADQRYPVLINVYGGPHSQMVMASSSRYLLNQWFADQGFIVVSLDGRGTPSRGREWERVIKGNLIQIPLEDQVEGLHALGSRYKELDLKRVGIYGWSFGGYVSAMAVMQRPDVFSAGIAGAPVVDWLDYDTHYTERYLGLPEKNAEGYHASSVLTYAPQLKQPLLIIHGTADDNVYFLHSVKLCDALFRAGVEYDFLPLAGFTHMVPDPLVSQRLYQRMADYFQNKLLTR